MNPPRNSSLPLHAPQAGTMDANGSGEATAAALVSGIVAATAVAVVAAAIAVFRRGGAATAASDVPGAPEGPGAPAVSTGAKQKKRKKKRPAAKAKVPFCQACQKELQPEFLEGHLQGKKHKANAAEAGIQGDDCFVFVKPAVRHGQEGFGQLATGKRSCAWLHRLPFAPLVWLLKYERAPGEGPSAGGEKHSSNRGSRL